MAFFRVLFISDHTSRTLSFTALPLLLTLKQSELESLRLSRIPQKRITQFRPHPSEILLCLFWVGPHMATGFVTLVSMPYEILRSYLVLPQNGLQCTFLCPFKSYRIGHLGGGTSFYSLFCQPKCKEPWSLILFILDMLIPVEVLLQSRFWVSGPGMDNEILYFQKAPRLQEIPCSEPPRPHLRCY